MARPRATTVSDLDNLTGTENPVLAGKRYLAPNQGRTSTRAALGEIGNKVRSLFEHRKHYNRYVMYHF